MTWLAPASRYFPAVSGVIPPAESSQFSQSVSQYGGTDACARILERSNGGIQLQIDMDVIQNHRTTTTITRGTHLRSAGPEDRPGAPPGPPPRTRAPA